jgi:hypothetical protein
MVIKKSTANAPSPNGSTITIKPSANVTEGEVVQFVCRPADVTEKYEIRISPTGHTPGALEKIKDPLNNDFYLGQQDVNFETAGYLAGTYEVSMYKVNAEDLMGNAYFHLQARQGASTNVTLQRSGSHPTDDQNLWAAIRNRTGADTPTTSLTMICVSASNSSSQLVGWIRASLAPQR